MACMCGDLYCFSCGPAQGNYQCSCGSWTLDIEEDECHKSCEAHEAMAYSEEEIYRDAVELEREPTDKELRESVQFCAEIERLLLLHYKVCEDCRIRDTKDEEYA